MCQIEADCEMRSRAGSLADETTCAAEPGVRIGGLQRGIRAVEYCDCLPERAAGLIASLGKGAPAQRNSERYWYVESRGEADFVVEEFSCHFVFTASMCDHAGQRSPRQGRRIDRRQMTDKSLRRLKISPRRIKVIAQEVKPAVREVDEGVDDGSGRCGQLSDRPRHHTTGHRQLPAFYHAVGQYGESRSGMRILTGWHGIHRELSVGRRVVDAAARVADE